MMPVIVMLPGIAAYVLNAHGVPKTRRENDGAYSAVLGFLPSGLKVSIAALTAAIVASLAGKQAASLPSSPWIYIRST
jgi:SSS family solute:Na+ symporter